MALSPVVPTLLLTSSLLLLAVYTCESVSSDSDTLKGLGGTTSAPVPQSASASSMGESSSDWRTTSAATTGSAPASPSFIPRTVSAGVPTAAEEQDRLRGYAQGAGFRAQAHSDTTPEQAAAHTAPRRLQASGTPTSKASRSSSITLSTSLSKSRSFSRSPSKGSAPSASVTPTISESTSLTATLSPTPSSTPSETPSITQSVIPTVSPTASATATVSASPPESSSSIIAKVGLGGFVSAVVGGVLVVAALAAVACYTVTANRKKRRQAEGKQGHQGGRAQRSRNADGDSSDSRSVSRAGRDSAAAAPAALGSSARAPALPPQQVFNFAWPDNQIAANTPTNSAALELHRQTQMQLAQAGYFGVPMTHPQYQQPASASVAAVHTPSGMQGIWGNPVGAFAGDVATENALLRQQLAQSEKERNVLAYSRARGPSPPAYRDPSDGKGAHAHAHAHAHAEEEAEKGLRRHESSATRATRHSTAHDRTPRKSRRSSKATAETDDDAVTLGPNVLEEYLETAGNESVRQVEQVVIEELKKRRRRAVSKGMLRRKTSEGRSVRFSSERHRLTGESLLDGRFDAGAGLLKDSELELEELRHSRRRSSAAGLLPPVLPERTMEFNAAPPQHSWDPFVPTDRRHYRLRRMQSSGPAAAESSVAQTASTQHQLRERQRMREPSASQAPMSPQFYSVPQQQQQQIQQQQQEQFQQPQLQQQQLQQQYAYNSGPPPAQSPSKPMSQFQVPLLLSVSAGDFPTPAPPIALPTPTLLSPSAMPSNQYRVVGHGAPARAHMPPASALSGFLAGGLSGMAAAAHPAAPAPAHTLTDVTPVSVQYPTVSPYEYSPMMMGSEYSYPLTSAAAPVYGVPPVQQLQYSQPSAQYYV